MEEDCLSTFGSLCLEVEHTITNQRTDEIVNCIGDQCLTIFVSNVDEVAVTIQLGIHVRKFELTQMECKCNEAKM